MDIKAGDVGASEPECCSPYLPRVSAVLIGRIVGGRYFGGGGYCLNLCQSLTTGQGCLTAMVKFFVLKDMTILDFGLFDHILITY